MKRIELTQNELRALEYLLYTKPCSSGCVYEEMQNSSRDCNECAFTQAIDSLIDKLGII